MSSAPTTVTERRKLAVTVLIETTGSPGQVDRTTRWVVSSIQGAARNAVGSCVVISVRDADTGEFMGVNATGEASSEMSEEITRLMKEQET